MNLSRRSLPYLFNLSLLKQCLVILCIFFQELLLSVGSIQFSLGRAEVEDVAKCVGDVSLLYDLL